MTKRSPFADPVDLLFDEQEKIRATALAPPGLTPAQHAARSTGVGASETWDALFNPGPLWLTKTGRAQREDDDAYSRLGQAIEPYIIGEAARALDLVDVHKPDTMRRGRMVAHLDAIASRVGVTGRVAVEAKWRGLRDGFGEPGSADVPQKILLQVMSQMRVAEIGVAYVPVLFLRPPVAIYEVPYDVELGDMVEEGIDRFWWHVEHDKAPDINPDAPDALAILRKIYPGTNGQRIQATVELEQWRDVYHDATAWKGKYETTADGAKAHLLRAMGEAAEMQFSDGKILRRKAITVKGYTVEPREQVDARFVNAKD
jgi:hypothetical protein